jgi:hypothetical protein
MIKLKLIGKKFIKFKMNEPEIFKPVNIKDFEKYYQVSTLGNVYSSISNKNLKCNNNNGYFNIRLNKPYDYQITVSRLVALTFVPNENPSINNVVNHIDENTHNNHYKNLEWVTQKENVNKATKNKTHEKAVLKMDLDGNVIDTYETVNKAAASIGVDRTTIGKVVCGVNQTAGGFRWSYKISENRPENRPDVNVDNGKCLDLIEKEYKDYYVFRDGKIYNKARKCFMKPCRNQKGAEYITLPSNKEDKNKQNVYINQLVARAYIENPLNKKRVMHINGIKSDNNMENLKWF